MKTRFCLLLLAVFSFPVAASANDLLLQFDRPRKKERDVGYGRMWHGVRFMDLVGVKGSLFYAFIDGEIELDKAAVIGDPVDLGPNLGLDNTATVAVPEIFFKYEPKEGAALRLGISYFWNRYEGDEEVLTGGDFVFEGWTIPAGTTWDSELDVLLGRITATITPYVIRLPGIEIRPSLYGGSVFMRYIIRLKTINNPGMVGDNGQIKDEFSATVGHIGMHLEVRVAESLQLYVFASGLQFHRNELFANYYEGGGGVTFEIFPFVAVNAEGFFARARLDRSDQYRFDFSIYGPSFSLILKY